MIRAKQITTLSSCVRTFLYTRSRCGKTDGGSSCACPNEEKHTSEKHHTNNFHSKPAHVAPANIRSAESVQLLGFIKILASQKAKKVEYATTLAQVATYAVDDAAELGHSGPRIGDHLVKVGTSTVLSDLMNYKVSKSSGSHFVVHSSHVMPVKKEVVHPEAEVVSSPPLNQSSSSSSNMSKNDN